MSKNKKNDELCDLFRVGDYGKRGLPRLEINQGFDRMGEASRLEHIKKVIDGGADPTSALLKAVYVGNIKELDLLISMGADVNSRGDARADHYPITRAVSRGKMAFVKTLLNAGASVHSTYKGMDAFLLAEFFSKPTVSTFLFSKFNGAVDFSESFAFHKYLENIKESYHYKQFSLETILNFYRAHGYDIKRKDENDKTVLDYVRGIISHVQSKGGDDSLISKGFLPFIEKDMLEEKLNVAGNEAKISRVKI